MKIKGDSAYRMITGYCPKEIMKIKEMLAVAIDFVSQKSTDWETITFVLQKNH